MKPMFCMIPRFNKDYDFKDVIFSIKSIFRRDAIEFKTLHSIYGDRTFFFINTGRTSLYVILRSLNLKKGSKIGVPLYSCTVVFDAILKAGCVPHFIDIDLDNYTIDIGDLAEKIDGLSAIVVIHTFGRPADMDRIKEVAGDVPIIEDCAHSILSRYGEEQTGTIGFASFFSFKKYLSTGAGGMIVLNDEEFVERFRREVGLLKSYTIIEEIRDISITYGHSFFYHRPWFGLFAHPVGSYLRSISNRCSGVEDIKANKIRKSDLYLLIRKLNGFEERVELQRKNSFFLLDELRDTSLVLPYEKKGTYCNYYLFPMRFDNKKERDEAHVRLRDMCIDTAKLYGETPRKAKRFYGYVGDCPNSEILADTVLIIPNYYTLTEMDLVKITNSIKKMEESL